MSPIKGRCHRVCQPELGVNPWATLAWGGVCRPTLSNWEECQWAHQSMQGLWPRAPWQRAALPVPGLLRGGQGHQAHLTVPGAGPLAPGKGLGHKARRRQVGVFGPTGLIKGVKPSSPG